MGAVPDTIFDYVKYLFPTTSISMGDHFPVDSTKILDAVNQKTWFRRIIEYIVVKFGGIFIRFIS